MVKAESPFKVSIEHGAMFAHELSELCNTEELIQLIASARHIRDLTGKEILSAMITDVPGWSWGLVPVLSGSGVKYLSLGTNYGPTDPFLPDMVVQWNKEFESLYGHVLPTVRGAFTGYWEDGAASSAKMTGLNRQNAGNASIINSLAVLKNNNEDLSDQIYELWRKILLYDEHTWGAYNSISEPESDFALQQWAVKSSYARDAALQAHKMRDDILNIDSRWRDNTGRVENRLTKVEIINTHSWPVTAAIEIHPSWGPAGTTVRDENGNKVASQLMSIGHIYFIAENVPPLASKIYFFSGDATAKPGKTKQGNIIENDLFILKVNESDGSIKSLTDRRNNIELVNNSELPGLNSYFYVEGRSPEIKYSPSEASVEVIEEGDLLSVIKTESAAPGCENITNYYTLVKGIEKVYITTVTDKKKIYMQEGVHLGFPFNIPGGDIHIDLALGVYEPDADQAEGACKNYFTPEGWVDDTPESQTIYSYIMNNYWETNYLAAQEGYITFRYVLHPHGMFNSAISEKRATEESERLVVVPESSSDRGMEPLFRINNDNIICITLIPTEDGYLIRLYNTGGVPEKLEISWRDKPEQVWFSDFDGKTTGSYENGTMVPGYGIRTIKVSINDEL